MNTRSRRLRRKITDTAFVAAVFPLALLAVLAVQRQDRKAGAR
jgi:hypothetical protein